MMRSVEHPPIIVPRWMLTAKYLILSILGIAVAVATAPSLAESIGHAASTLWGIGMFLSAIVAAWASITPARESSERWSVAALSVLLIVYALSPVLIILTTGDTDRIVYSVTALALSGLPIVRALYLLRRTGLNSKVK